MKSPKSIFTCSECGHTTVKWYGKCPSCGAWNTMEEGEPPVETAVSASARTIKRIAPEYESEIVRFDDLELPHFIRQATGMGELDRVLGGGLVHGSVVLLAGEPGIGKSTLLLQISSSLALGAPNPETGEVSERKVLYVSGEESQGQLKLRAKRLGVRCSSLYVLTETNVERILRQCDKLHPDVIIVDSIQTMYDEHVASAPGSVTQVRESALAFISKAKNEGISVIMVGHVNKEGGIAGPKVLEHMVDAVLYFEGEKLRSYRIIRAIKNRFGSTNEIGMFEMSDGGLEEVANPSEALLSGRPAGVSGNCAMCIMEGTRPIIAEVQALVAQTSYPSPRRTSNGIDYNRMCLILAVLEKRLGYRFSVNDAYLNVIGGLHVDEPASDLAVALALISSIKDEPVADDLIAIGEIGLAGECRAVQQFEQRVSEAVRLGFRKIIVPQRNYEKKSLIYPDVKLIPVKSIFDKIDLSGK
ncbi:MAG: DNA repair protein RadA [Clostridiales bacterium]|nr:DNA repair protein RadA [Clostridiales bacterium]